MCRVCCGTAHSCVFWCARTATTGAFQMQGVAVGWQLYEMTGNPLDLGIVGLVQFLPLVVLRSSSGRSPTATTAAW